MEPTEAEMLTTIWKGEKMTNKNLKKNFYEERNI